MKKQISIVLITERDDIEVQSEVRKKLADIPGIIISGCHIKNLNEKFERGGGDYER